MGHIKTQHQSLTNKFYDEKMGVLAQKHKYHEHLKCPSGKTMHTAIYFDIEEKRQKGYPFLKCL